MIGWMVATFLLGFIVGVVLAATAAAKMDPTV